MEHSNNDPNLDLFNWGRYFGGTWDYDYIEHMLQKYAYFQLAIGKCQMRNIVCNEKWKYLPIPKVHLIVIFS